MKKSLLEVARRSTWLIENQLFSLQLKRRLMLNVRNSLKVTDTHTHSNCSGGINFMADWNYCFAQKLSAESVPGCQTTEPNNRSRCTQEPFLLFCSSSLHPCFSLPLFRISSLCKDTNVKQIPTKRICVKLVNVRDTTHIRLLPSEI